MKNKKSFWGSLFDSLSIYFKAFFSKEKLLKYLEEKAIKAVLKKFLIVGGLKAWLITFVVEHLIGKADQHLIEPAFRKVGFIKDSLEGKAIYKRIEDAENRDDWRDAVRDS